MNEATDTQAVQREQVDKNSTAETDQNGLNRVILDWQHKTSDILREHSKDLTEIKTKIFSVEKATSIERKIESIEKNMGKDPVLKRQIVAMLFGIAWFFVFAAVLILAAKIVPDSFGEVAKFFKVPLQ